MAMPWKHHGRTIELRWVHGWSTVDYDVPAVGSAMVSPWMLHGGTIIMTMGVP